MLHCSRKLVLSSVLINYQNEMNTFAINICTKIFAPLCVTAVLNTLSTAVANI